MTSVTEFRLPDVGEGLTEAEIVNWHVEVGDVVKVNDVLVEIETAKSVVELPAPAAGRITAIHVEVGEMVEVGTLLVSIDAPASVPEPTPEHDDHPAQTQASETPPPAAQTEPQPEQAADAPSVLVGTGPSEPARRRRRVGGPDRERTLTGAARDTAPAQPPSGRVNAKPAARLLARELGVELATVDHDGGAPITQAAVLEAADRQRSRTHLPGSAETESRIPITGIRKATAAAVTRSAFTAPHVTEWLSVDVTASMDLLARLKADRQWSGVRLTPLLLVARAFLLAIRRHPAINARWDEDNQQIVEYRHVNLGIAAATARGLIVPNIKHADALDLAGLANALGDLVDTARAGRTTPEQMMRGTVTITNIGALGVDAGTPILNPGEAAILAFGSVRLMPWVVDGQVVPRQVTQLAMSFDHRLVDGELGSHVLADVGRILHDPAEAMVMA